MRIENINIKNENDEVINSAQDETVLLLRRIVKMMESGTVVDSNMRQKMIADVVWNASGAFPIAAGGTNYPTIGAPGINTTVYYIPTWSGPIDPRWTNLEQARISYNTRIRKNLIFT